MEREQFETCWHDTMPRVLAYARRHVSGDEAYDVVSATYLTAWRTWDAVPDHALAWLLSTAHGQIRNHLRSCRRQLQLADRIELLGSTAATPEDAAVTAHLRNEALRTLAALPEQDREALLLVAWDGLTTEQAAAFLGCRPSALRTRLHRVRKRLDATVARPTDSPDFTARSSR